MLRLASVALTAVCSLAFASSALASGVHVLTPDRVPHRSAPVEQRVHPVLPHDPAALRAGKAAAQQAPLRSPLAELASPQAAPSAVVSGSLNQAGLSAGDHASRNDGSPPDPTGAAAPSTYFEFGNSVVGMY